MEYLLDNVDWLKDELDNYDDDEYIIFDCPGQVELYRYVLRYTFDTINKLLFLA
jgi:GPN-loop GTPase